MKRALLLLALFALAIGVLAFAYIYHSEGPASDHLVLAPSVADAPGSAAPSSQNHELDLVHLLPPGAPAIAFADVAELRASAFARELAALAPTSEQDPQYTDFVRATGFDYSRDLDRAAMALWPRDAPTTVVVIAEGRFDRRKIASYALQSGRLNKADGREIYEVPEQGSNRRIRFSFLAPNRLALADGPALDEVLNSPNGHILDPAMSARLARVSGAAIFSVARTENLPKDIGLDESRSAQLARMLRSVRSISLAGQPEAKNFDLSAVAECDSALDALQLMTLLDGLRWMGRAALADPKVRLQIGPQWQPLDELLKAATLSHSGKTLHLRAQLTEQMLAEASGSSSGKSSVR